MRGVLQTTLTVDRLFPTPVLICSLSDGELIDDLEAAICARRAEFPGIERSNVGGWHSAPDFLDWSGDAGKTLIQQVADLASEHSLVHKTGRQPDAWRVEAWANINETGHFNRLHGHGGAFWSAVFYVRADPESGPLVLSDPRYPMCGMHAPQLRFKDMGPQEEAIIRPSRGVLVLFPAWLMHSVGPSRGQGLRISVAINLSATQPEEAK